MRWSIPLCAALLVSIGFPFSAHAQTPLPGNRWALQDPAGIFWNVRQDTNLPHEDHIEMSGHYVSEVIFFGAGKDRSLELYRQVIWPMLRTYPNKTDGSLGRQYPQSAEPLIYLNGDASPTTETVESMIFDGVLSIHGTLGPEVDVNQSIVVPRDLPCVIDNWTLQNLDPKKTISVKIVSPDLKEVTPADQGYKGMQYELTAQVDKPGTITLKPSDTYQFSFIIYGRPLNDPMPAIDGQKEEAARRMFVAHIESTLQLQTPDPVIDRMFELSKVRTTESIFKTTVGLMHSPGGGLKTPRGHGRYYAAIWANDQAEYAGPFFPYLGDSDGDTAALNAYQMFAKYMNDDYKPIPSSIIAEGTGTWHGAGDRGDDAMIAYGAARYALARGDEKIARELYPLVQWCLEYCHRKLNDAGVVASDHDELEGRLPAGTANLHTSVLYYDALLSGADLARALGQPETVATAYEAQAKTLRANIENYFAANVQGFATYRYYDGDTVLRAWICSPLSAGIMDRKDGTIAALTSPLLWGPDGLTTAAGRDDFWDRSTLYALRGMFIANEPDLALKYMHQYSNHRLLGDHVPYAVEANPEGNQSHLAAESALYARIVTEGMFGIRPTSLNSFRFTPSMPSSWQQMSLKHIRAFGSDFDLDVQRQGNQLQVTVTHDGKSDQHLISPGQSVDITL